MGRLPLMVTTHFCLTRVVKDGWLGLIEAPSEDDRNAIRWYFALTQLLFNSRIGFACLLH